MKPSRTERGRNPGAGKHPGKPAGGRKPGRPGKPGAAKKPRKPKPGLLAKEIAKMGKAKPGSAGPGKGPNARKGRKERPVPVLLPNDMDDLGTRGARAEDGMEGLAGQYNETVNWFPGHMLKAKKELVARMKMVDAVIEIRDARLPASSTNPDFADVLKSKPRVVLLNKADLADESISEEWKKSLDTADAIHLLVDVRSNRGVSKVLPAVRSLLIGKWDKYKRKGINPPIPRVMVVGIPNVGKSSLINRLAGRNVAQVGPKPGVTRHQFWLKLGPGIELLDTPGVLWPKFDDPMTGLSLAAAGAVRDQVAGEEKVTLFLMEFLRRNYPGRLRELFSLTDENGELESLLVQVAERRGCLKAKGVPDLPRAAAQVLKDFRDGRLGKVSFERPIKIEALLKATDDAGKADESPNADVANNPESLGEGSAGE